MVIGRFGFDFLIKDGERIGDCIIRQRENAFVNGDDGDLGVCRRNAALIFDGNVDLRRAAGFERFDRRLRRHV